MLCAVGLRRTYSVETNGDYSMKKNCKKCGIEFNTKPSHFKRRTFCSLLCYWSDGGAGARRTPETREKFSHSIKGKFAGSKNPMWRGGITPENTRIRMSTEYKKWRISVFKRDNYTCQSCNKRGVYIQADHIKQFAYYPELRFETSNGRTLCVDCHKKTPTFGFHKIKTASL